MSKRPNLNLMAITEEAAAPMPEAIQRSSAPKPAAPAPAAVMAADDSTKTANLEALAFKVPKDFRRRFKSVAAERDLKLNELLFACFEAYQSQHS
jgi:hypothetical protein